MTLTAGELLTIANALNEVSNGIRELDDDDEFAARIGASRDEVRRLLAQFHSMTEGPETFPEQHAYLPIGSLSSGIMNGVRLFEPIVDLLPRSLWKLGNNYMLPGGDWHFCVGDTPRFEHSVRTIEWRGREIARGRRPFDPGWSDAP